MDFNLRELGKYAFEELTAEELDSQTPVEFLLRDNEIYFKSKRKTVWIQYDPQTRRVEYLSTEDVGPVLHRINRAINKLDLAATFSHVDKSELERRYTQRQLETMTLPIHPDSLLNPNAKPSPAVQEVLDRFEKNQEEGEWDLTM